VQEVAAPVWDAAVAVPQPPFDQAVGRWHQNPGAVEVGRAAGMSQNAGKTKQKTKKKTAKKPPVKPSITGKQIEPSTHQPPRDPRHGRLAAVSYS
jgi:hypothetical protein